MNVSEKNYLKIAEDILSGGAAKEDRTKVGILSTFGTRLEFDLQEGFPLLTTKKTWFKGVAEELLWLLSGKTNIRPLQSKGVHIWDAWASEGGALGPVYGKQWRGWEKFEIVKTLTVNYPPIYKDLEPEKISGFGHNYEGKQDSLVFKDWVLILQNLQHGTTEIDPHWLDFDVFREEVTRLENWHLKQTFPSLYTLDSHYWGANVFAPGCTRWSSKKEIQANADEHYWIATKGSHTIPIKDLRSFCDTYGVSFEQAEFNLAYKGIHYEDSYSISKVKLPMGLAARVKYHDQIHEAIYQIKNNPSSRRILFTGWNVSELSLMALPPCHMMMQFYVDGDKLSGQLYQRSCDWFLGVPFNIASYSLLVHMIASVCDLKPGKFIHIGGDAHIYKNHIAAMEKQIAREPFDFPSLQVKKKTLIEDFAIEDFVLTDYKHHPALSGQVAV